VSVVLRVPGVLSALLSSCIAQIPMGALGLLLVLHTRDVTGTYASGGGVAAAYALALGVSNPVLARLADRRGPIGLLLVGAPIAAAAIVLQAALPDDAPLVARIGLAAVTGATQPPIGAFRRRLWPVLVPDDDARHRLYATEGVLLEIVYVLGPVVVVAGVGSWSTSAALILCGAAILTGNVAFSRHPAIRRLTGAPSGGHGLVGALRGPGVLVATVVFLFLGFGVGSTEVGVPAALEAMGDRGLTGLALGLWGAGSALAGVVVARSGVPRRPAQRLLVLAGAWGLGHAAIALAGSPLVLCVLALVAGATISPTFTVINGLLDRLALPGTLTEAFTWVSTGMVVGAAAGGALAGHLVESASPAAGLALGGVGLLGAAVAGATQGILRGDARPAAVAAAD
jgi:MFS family permease